MSLMHCSAAGVANQMPLAPPAECDHPAGGPGAHADRLLGLAVAAGSERSAGGRDRCRLRAMVPAVPRFRSRAPLGVCPRFLAPALASRRPRSTHDPRRFRGRTASRSRDARHAGVRTSGSSVSAGSSGRASEVLERVAIGPPITSEPCEADCIDQRPPARHGRHRPRGEAFVPRFGAPRRRAMSVSKGRDAARASSMVRRWCPAWRPPLHHPVRAASRVVTGLWREFLVAVGASGSQCDGRRRLPQAVGLREAPDPAGHNETPPM